MNDDDRHPPIQPSTILDVDNGADFAFEGLGLKGNRPAPVSRLRHFLIACAGLVAVLLAGLAFGALFAACAIFVEALWCGYRATEL